MNTIIVIADTMVLLPITFDALAPNKTCVAVPSALHKVCTFSSFLPRVQENVDEHFIRVQSCQTLLAPHLAR